MYDAAEAAGLSKATIRRAKAKTGIKAKRVGGVGSGGYGQGSLQDAKVLKPNDEHLRAMGWTFDWNDFEAL